MMWDWEGKLVDESVVEKLLGKYGDYFKRKPIGKKVFLTFRVPNPRVESGYRLGRAFMVILSAQNLAYTAKLSDNPLFEIILPMAESAEDILNIQTSWRRISQAACDSFGPNGSDKVIEVIPIFESVHTILRSGEIIRKYARLAQNQLGKRPLYLRPFVARSDPALNSGVVPTTLAIKWALSEYAKFSQEQEIPTYPIIAPGTLPFRGGLTPENYESFINEFPGIRTLVIQSSFRYDFPKQKVRHSVKQLSQKIPKLNTQLFPDDILNQIRKIIPWFEIPYRETVEMMAPVIREVTKYVPTRRERVQHIGLFGYSREIGKVRLPRAIGFCASCYSLGIPPELIGTGRGLLRTKKEKSIDTVESLYRNLKPALITAGRYLRKESIKELGYKNIAEDIRNIEDFLGEELGPKTADDYKHLDQVTQIVSLIKRGKNPQRQIEQAAYLRKSLG